MITAEYCQSMARYNRWQNDSLLGAAERLDETARRLDRGAFFGSIHGTLSHLLWGDTIWMSRFDGGVAPRMRIPESPRFADRWDDLVTRRAEMDARIIGWADGLTDFRPGAELRWVSGALGREVSRPLGLCIAHFFNHQTHHRGQVHGMLTASGGVPEDTDLFVMDMG